MTIAFVDGPVFVGDGRILDRATVLVEDDRIVKVATADAALPQGAEIVSLKGAMLFPGFIDCHVHLCLDAGADPLRRMAQEGLAASTLLAAANARKTLLSGVTAVRDLGAPDGLGPALRQAQVRGEIPGPRVLAANRCVCMTGGHGWMMGREADGPDQVRQAAREQIKAGADIVKLMATGGVMTPGAEPGRAELTEAELKAGIEEAHKAGKKTATHAQGTTGILNALRAGIDSVEHGFFLDEEACALMVKNGAAYVPTLSAVHFIVVHGLAAGIPDYMVAKAERVKGAHVESLRLARALGVKIGLGTDAGTPFNGHGQNLREAGLMVQAGVPPLEVLKSATLTAAEILGLAGEIGSVEEGKLADLVVVAKDPLSDVTVLEDPANFRFIVQDGRMVKGEA